MSVLLVYPPLGAPHIPPLSAAHLVAHLRARGLAVRGLDLNNAFYRWAFEAGRLRAAARSAGDAERAAFAEIEARIETLVDPPPGARPSEQDRLLGLAARVFSASRAPEAFEIDWPGVSFRTPFDVFSSADLRRGASSPGLFAGFLDEALEAALEGVRLVGISVSWPAQILPALRVAAAARRLAPGVRVVLGGAFVAAHGRRMTSTALLDLVDGLVDGDGEAALERLARGAAPEGVPGLVFARDGRLVRNPPAAPVPMDDLPAPDYADFDLDRYLAPRSAMWLPVRLTRGCQWGRCTFCRTDLVAHCASPSVDRALSWIRAVVGRTGVRAVNFTDDEASPALLEPLCRRILDERLDLLWTATHRFEECLTPERCRLYAEAGCRFLFLGLESTSDRILKLMKKGTTLARVERVLANLRGAGIRAHAFMIVGFPGETEAEALEGYDRLLRWRREGLLFSYNYSSFQLLPRAPVDLDRAAFGIRGVPPSPPGRDLDHTVFDFECDGMPRAAARALEKRFNGARSP